MFSLIIKDYTFEHELKMFRSKIHFIRRYFVCLIITVLTALFSCSLLNFIN